MLRRAMVAWTRHRLVSTLRLAFPCLVLVVAAHLPASRHAAALPAVAGYTPLAAERLLNPEPHNWPMYRRTYDGWGYSPLDGITPANVASLQPVWTFSTGSGRDHQSPPIVNDGHMFVTVPLDDGSLQVLALDAATGDLLWRHVLELPEDAAKHRNKVNRGVALYWDNVFVGTADAAVVALDAVTGGDGLGAPDRGPGRRPQHHHGAARRRRDDHGRGVGRWVRHTRLRRRPRRRHRPRFLEDVHHSGPGRARQRDVARGDVAHGRRSGVGDPACDPVLDQVYWGTGNPSPWMGDARPGDNPYSNSVLALDAATGGIVGYHQYHHNGSWKGVPTITACNGRGRTLGRGPG